MKSQETANVGHHWTQSNTEYRKDANAGHHSQSNKEKIDSKINLRGVVGTLFQNTPIQQSLFQVVNHNLSLTNQSYFISALFDCFTWTILNYTDKDMAFVHVRLTLLTQSCTTKSAQLDHFHFQLFASLGNQLITEPNDLMSHDKKSWWPNHNATGLAQNILLLLFLCIETQRISL